MCTLTINGDTDETSIWERRLKAQDHLTGLSFTVRAGDVYGSPALLNNTLALTLESLRGLPLHLIGTAMVKDTWIDPLGDIQIDVHPEATLTRIYFENLFCLAPITAPDGRTEYGIRVSLTDDNDPDTPDVLIFGELRDVTSSSASPVASTSYSTPKVLHLLAARILPGPPPSSSFRLPRPDDPTPRRPPLAFGAKRKRDTIGVPFNLTGGSAESGKRAKTASAKGSTRASVPVLDEEAMRQAAAEVMRRMPKPHKANSAVNIQTLGKDARVGTKKEKDVFKVPSVPLRRSTSETDVFGGQAANGGSPAVSVGDPEIEKENKAVLKKAVVKILAENGIVKSHIEYKELFQMCYRGASFALRRSIASGLLDAQIIDRYVMAHVQMYVCEGPT